MTRNLFSTIQHLLQAGRAKIVFGILAIFLFLAIIVFVAKFISLQDRNSSQIILTADQNKFKLNFNLANQDMTKFSKVLDKLNLPQSVKDGIEFELDATSSAKLAFVIPIKTDFNILPEKITFQGQVDKSFVSDQAAESLKIPASTNLAVFGNNIAEFVRARLNFPDQFSTWFSKNLNSQNGQYFIVFGANSDFALVFKNPSIDIDGLKNIKDVKSNQSLYKEESIDNIKLYLLKLSESLDEKDLTIVFFQEGDWTFFASSPDAAQKLLKIQKSQIPSINFPLKNNSLISLILLYRNSDKNPIGENFPQLIFAGNGGLAKTMDQIEEFEFILKKDKFSGLINLK